MRLHTVTLVSAFAFLASACTRMPIQGSAAQGEILFSPAVTSSSTKVIFEGGAFPTDAGAFSVSAIALDGNNQSLYFFNKPVNYTGTKWAFKPDESGVVPRYYWPLAGGMNFYAFYPESEELTARGIIVPDIDPATGQPETVPSILGGGIVYKNYTLKHTLGAGGGYAPIEDDADKTDSNLDNAYLDFMASSQLYDDVNTRTTSSVPLLFTHNLAQIRFRAVAEKDLSNVGRISTADGSKSFDVVNHVDFSVDKIELINIYSTATYYNIAPHWRDLKDKYNYFPLTRAEMGTGTQLRYSDGTPGSRTPVEVDIEKDGGEPVRMLVIPQYLTDASMKVWFTVRQHTVRNEGKADEFSVNDYSETYVKTIDIAPVIKDFKISSCVTLLFHIDLKEIELTVTYSDWKSDGMITPVI